MRASRGAAALLLPGLLAAACARVEPLPLSLDPADPLALKVTSPGTTSRYSPPRGRSRQGELEIHAIGGSAMLTLPGVVPTDRLPVLHLAMRHGASRPPRVRILITGTREDVSARPRADTPAPSLQQATYAYDAGAWAAGTTRDLWLPLDRADGNRLPDAFHCAIRDLSIHLQGLPDEMSLSAAVLHPRSLEARVRSLVTRLQAADRAPDNLYAFLAILIVAPLVGLWQVGIPLLRLPRPWNEPSVVIRNAGLRFARDLPASLLLVTMLLGAGEAALQGAEVLRAARVNWQVMGRTSDEEQARLHDADIHPDLSDLVRQIGRSTPATASVTMLPPVKPIAVFTSRYRLFPRMVSSRDDGDYLASLGGSGLRTLDQPVQNRWLALTPEAPAGQSFEVPAPESWVLCIEVRTRPGSIPPNQELVLDIYATDRVKRAQRTIAARGYALFPVDPPLRLFGGRAYFQLSLGRGPGIAADVAAADGNPYKAGGANHKDMRTDTDLAFRIVLNPEGTTLPTRAGRTSYLFARAQDTGRGSGSAGRTP